MKLLLTSDLHGDEAKLNWLRDHAPRHDALLVAGDHLDIFSSTNEAAQQKKVLAWAQSIVNDGRTLIWSSGNHDFFTGEDTPMAEASPRWMRESATNSQRWVTDGETRLLELGTAKLVVTTLPWPVTGNPVARNSGGSENFADYVAGLVRAGSDLRKKHGAPWILLAHEPPVDTPLAVDYFSGEAMQTRQVIESAQPDFSLHGHLHESPTHDRGAWRTQIGSTCCLNAGQTRRGELPQCILLDWESPLKITARWIAEESGKRGRWEDPEWE